MAEPIKTTIDAAGRLVVPKPIRERAGIVPGDALTVVYRDGRIEIEPAPREVRVTDREGFRVAEPVGSYAELTAEAVQQTRDDLRETRKPGPTRRR